MSKLGRRRYWAFMGLKNRPHYLFCIMTFIFFAQPSLAQIPGFPLPGGGGGGGGLPGGLDPTALMDSINQLNSTMTVMSGDFQIFNQNTANLNGTMQNTNSLFDVFNGNHATTNGELQNINQNIAQTNLVGQDAVNSFNNQMNGVNGQLNTANQNLTNFTNVFDSQATTANQNIANFNNIFNTQATEANQNMANFNNIFNQQATTANQNVANFTNMLDGQLTNVNQNMANATQEIANANKMIDGHLTEYKKIISTNLDRFNDTLEKMTDPKHVAKIAAAGAIGAVIGSQVAKMAVQGVTKGLGFLVKLIDGDLKKAQMAAGLKVFRGAKEQLLAAEKIIKATEGALDSIIRIQTELDKEDFKKSYPKAGHELRHAELGSLIEQKSQRLEALNILGSEYLMPHHSPHQSPNKMLFDQISALTGEVDALKQERIRLTDLDKTLFMIMLIKIESKTQTQAELREGRKRAPTNEAKVEIDEQVAMLEYDLIDLQKIKTSLAEHAIDSMCKNLDGTFLVDIGAAVSLQQEATKLLLNRRNINAFKHFKIQKLKELEKSLLQNRYRFHREERIMDRDTMNGAAHVFQKQYMDLKQEALERCVYIFWRDKPVRRRLGLEGIRSACLTRFFSITRNQPQAFETIFGRVSEASVQEYSRLMVDEYMKKSGDQVALDVRESYQDVGAALHRFKKVSEVLDDGQTINVPAHLFELAQMMDFLTNLKTRDFKSTNVIAPMMQKISKVKDICARRMAVN